MKIRQTISNWISPPKKWEHDYVLEKGPVIQDVQYYYFPDMLNAPPERFLVAQQFLTEYSMRFERENLLKEIQARQALEKRVQSSLTASGGSLNLIELANIMNEMQRLTMQAKERLTAVTEPDLIYKVASVFLIDDNEQPHTYDDEYNRQKIEKWRRGNVATQTKSPEIAFFLTVPMKNILGLGGISKSDLKNYLDVAQKVKTQHLSNISRLLSGRKKPTA